MTNSFVLKGNILYSLTDKTLCSVDNGFLVVIDGLVEGVFKTLPDKYKHLELTDFGDNLIIPGLVDLHIHAPQFPYRGTNMDLELMPWLYKVTFPEEAKYEEEEYAAQSYHIFAKAMKKSATTRLVAFSTCHRRGTEILMDEMEKTGLISYIGKVNMDRNAPDILREKSAEESIRETEEWLSDIKGKYSNTYPILTPRFIPSCSDSLMEKLGEVRKKYNLPVQSHLSESLGEIEEVSSLRPEDKFYGEGYDKYGLFGGEERAIMAHCVFSKDEEIALMKKNGVYIAHCPECNENIASGMAPVRRYLDEGLNIGLGSDVAGGSTESIFSSMTEAIRVSKMRWRYVDSTLKPLTFEEAFYLATLSGGSFFGNVGSFLPGFEADILVLDDSAFPTPSVMDSKKRLERFSYLGGDRGGIKHKFVFGRNLF